MMGENALERIRIILVEPAGALNVGSVARVMKNMGLHHLILVNPQCDPQSQEARQMAVHGGDILEAASHVQTLPEALVGCQRAIATTGCSHSPEIILEHPRVALPWLLETPAALIFGREDRGLTHEELHFAQRLIQIPTSPIYPSLNLAQAVAVCCYELYQMTQEPLPHSPTFKSPAGDQSSAIPRSQAPLEQLEAYYQNFEALLLKIGYLYPHTATRRMEKFRRLFNRALPSSEEVAMLRGIVHQVEWAINCHQSGAVDDTLKTSPNSD